MHRCSHLAEWWNAGRGEQGENEQRRAVESMKMVQVNLDGLQPSLQVGDLVSVEEKKSL